MSSLLHDRYRCKASILRFSPRCYPGGLSPPAQLASLPTLLEASDDMVVLAELILQVRAPSKAHCHLAGHAVTAPRSSSLPWTLLLPRQSAVLPGGCRGCCWQSLSPPRWPLLLHRPDAGCMQDLDIPQLSYLTQPAAAAAAAPGQDILDWVEHQVLRFGQGAMPAFKATTANCIPRQPESEPLQQRQQQQQPPASPLPLHRHGLARRLTCSSLMQV